MPDLNLHRHFWSLPRDPLWQSLNVCVHCIHAHIIDISRCGLANQILGFRVSPGGLATLDLSGLVADAPGLEGRFDTARRSTCLVTLVASAALGPASGSTKHRSTPRLLNVAC